MEFWAPLPTACVPVEAFHRPPGDQHAPVLLTMQSARGSQPGRWQLMTGVHPVPSIEVVLFCLER